MSIVGGVWEYSSFQGALSSLLNLNSNQLGQLRTLVSSGFEVPVATVAEQLGVTSAQSRMLLAAASTIYSLARRADASGDEVVGEIESLLQTSDESLARRLREIRHQLVELFSESPEIEHAILKRSAEAALAPQLDTIDVGVDLRVVGSKSRPNGSVSLDKSLVPTVMVRLAFDETIGVGDAVSFQVPPWMVRELIDRFEDARETLKLIESQLEDWLL